jgi:hypothetical protein
MLYQHRSRRLDTAEVRAFLERGRISNDYLTDPVAIDLQAPSLVSLS